MSQQFGLFDNTPSEKPTTAVYPNRERDKRRVEDLLGLSEHGNSEQCFYTSKGTLFAKGYVRIVYGDHGSYLEFEKLHVLCELKQKFKGPVPESAFYEWLEPTDGSEVKVYDQRKDVRELPNPPAGGFRGNRAEGYADYKPGFIYVSPWQLRLKP